MVGNPSEGDFREIFSGKYEINECSEGWAETRRIKCWCVLRTAVVLSYRMIAYLRFIYGIASEPLD